jgi:Kef-type K+ transport system membrane component KefB
VLRHYDRTGARRRLHQYSQQHGLALELRINLIILFALAALALSTHVSIMLAGFALGLVLAAIGEPRRLARQLFGITEGFFAPLFFIWLGASLQVRELGQHRAYILLGLGLGVGAVAAHCAGRALGQPLVLGALSAAQLGVPVAAATLGTEQHLLAPGEPSALILGALVTIATTSIAGRLAARRQNTDAAPSPGT